MKKQLLTSTALVAAGVLAFTGPALAQGKPTLTLGGSTEQIFGVGENEDDFDAANGARVGWDQISDTEIHFKGAVTLDNGIKIATRTELEGNSTGGGDTIDENWMRISGSFGEVRMGSMDGAAQAMTTGYMGTYSTGVGQSVGFDTREWIQAPAAVTGASTVHRVDLTSDGEAIGYYTPRFSGFQFGISYHPSSNEDNATRELKTAGDSEGWSLGVNYVGKFSGVGIGIAAGYNDMEESTVGQSDPEVWGVAARVDFQGFRVSASWIDQDSQETIATGVTAVPGVESLELGLRYSFGPNAVSIGYLSAEAQTAQVTAGGAGDESEVVMLAYRRTLGPGVNWTLSAIFAEFDNGALGAAANTSNEGEALVTSVKVSF